MKETKALEEKIRNLTFITILGFVIVLLLIIGLYFKDGKSDTTTTNNNSNAEENNISYDVSKFNEVDVDNALDLFKKKDTQILYIGRSDCGYCQKTVPVLTEVQEDLKFTTNYLAVETSTINKDWKTWQEELEPLAKKLNKETTVGETTDKFGELLVSKGYTPAVIIIKNGKMVDGFFGYKDKENIKSLIEKYI